MKSYRPWWVAPNSTPTPYPEPGATGAKAEDAGGKIPPSHAAAAALASTMIDTRGGAAPITTNRNLAESKVELRKSSSPKINSVFLGVIASILVLALLSSIIYWSTQLAVKKALRDGAIAAAPNQEYYPSTPTQQYGRSFSDIAVRLLPSVVSVSVISQNREISRGSGFVIDEAGYIVTNHHVVAEAAHFADPIQVRFHDGSLTEAELVGSSPESDLAILWVPENQAPAAPLGNSDSARVGDAVIAIGSPLGLSGTVTSGIISSVNRPVTAGQVTGTESYINALQTDAAINPGNSGGPLANATGQIIGVNSSIATIHSSNYAPGGSIGLGFAIPINQAKRVAQQIITTGRATYPVIGAILDLNYPGPGARIAQEPINGQPPLVPEGPAAQAGLLPGDIILEFVGTRVLGSDELLVLIRSQNPGDLVDFLVERAGEQFKVTVELGEAEGTQ